jgi:CheY-like chemotaxis protein
VFDRDLRRNQFIRLEARNGMQFPARVRWCVHVNGILRRCGFELNPISQKNNSWVITDPTHQLPRNEHELAAESQLWFSFVEDDSNGSSDSSRWRQWKKLRRSVADILQDEGYSIVDAATGKQALAQVKSARQQFDLLITDLSMPEMDGLQLLTEIKRTDPGLPVIAMSGSFSGRLLEVRRNLWSCADWKALQTSCPPIGLEVIHSCPFWVQNETASKTSFAKACCSSGAGLVNKGKVAEIPPWSALFPLSGTLPWISPPLEREEILSFNGAWTLGVLKFAIALLP